jgi:ABC-type branched-subunit amino acid transport system ATPase component
VTHLVAAELTKNFGALAAVDALDFEVAPGEVCGLVGPNGSGKTTLLNLVSGVLPVTSGTVSLGGVEVTNRRASKMARAGLSRTFQLIRLVKSSTAIENVLAGLYPVASDRHLHRALFPFALRSERAALESRAEEALADVGLAEHRNDVVDELPFGFQRRVELARAIVSEPSVLLLDEPAAGVTEGDIRELARIIDEQSRRGCTVVLVDHHLRFVLDVCPRLIVMNFGRKIFDGPSEAAIEDPGVREAYVGG